ncbi:glycosyltransferase family 2 protein [Ancylobacter mangrovi]|uniref:glycosyltransferase family 2 protein n=1 Tax=Ancylobacter mangrovi TaxID=2972472 RepID=UPI0021615FE5|nr:glycosyltransferase [Ancylobacter mangrovi]MCS0503133.1 glycosyltransferase [Ancylobacter mangrovi]
MNDYPLTIRLTPAGALAPGQSWPRPALDDWYALADPTCRFHPDIRSILRVAATARPDVDIFYGDAVETAAPARGTAGKGAAQDRLILKPGFDITQLIAQDYIGWPLFIRGRALEALGPPGPEAGDAAGYDLLLRANAAGMMVERIAEILSARGATPAPDNLADRRHAVRAWLDHRLEEAEILPGRLPTTLRLHRPLAEPPEVTLVVPTRQTLCTLGEEAMRGRPLVLNLLESLARSSWPMDRLTVLVGDDIEDGAAYADRDWPFRLERVVTRRAPDEPFNYARKMNALWPLARSEYVVFLNDDIVVRQPDWIEALMSFACDEDVGGVGARLLYPDGRIQHAGMVGGVMGTCTHVFIKQAATAPSYENWADVHREYSMVTGAAFATRRSLLERINGFDEQFALDWNDVDMCLRMRLLGLRIVYTPHAELTHYESASRGASNLPGADLALFLERWSELLDNDPAYNPGLVRNSPLTAPAPLTYKGWWRE